MGGSSKKVTVGYKYYLGIHMILCHGPVDKIVRIRVDEKDAWLGSRRAGSIRINRSDLFGGESREGGIEGYLDFETGEPTQGVNDYLQSRLGGLVPAFRGVVGVVLRQMYIGMNPYLKKWDFRVSRVMVRQDGLPQWYPQMAVIPTAAAFAVRQRILFALDTSGSMAEPVGGGRTRLDVMKDNMIQVLDELSYLSQDSPAPVDVAIRTLSGSSRSYTAIGQAQINSLKTFIMGLSASGGTSFTSSFAYAKSWFSPHSGERHNVMVIVTDGAPDPLDEFPNTLAEAAPILSRQGDWSGNNEVEVYGVNIDLDNVGYTEQLINTPQVGVPVIDGSDPTALYNAIFFAFMGESPAMNIVHAIRETLTDPDWGMGYMESDLDDASFRAAARQLRAERLGVCILWDRQKSIEDFTTELLKHANAALFVDRRTGLFKIRLIRDDYDADNILELDERHIQKVENFRRPTFGELTTSVTINYWNVTTGASSSVTAQDPALAAMQGAPVATTLQFIGLPDAGMAGRVAMLNLRSLSGQYASCDIYADRTARDLEIGDVFKATWPEFGLHGAVMRVVSMAYGDGKTNRIKITCMEDAFSMPLASPVTPSEPIWDNPAQPPKPATRQLSFEVPYLELVQRQGQDVVDLLLTNNPDASYVGGAAVSPGGSAINARIYVDSGTGYEDSGLVDFSPGADVAAPVSRSDTQIAITEAYALDQVTLGTWLQIGTELMAIEGINELGGFITVKRGVLDTVPTTHEAGASIIFWDEYSSAEDTEYVSGETIGVKIAPVSGSGEVPLTDAVAMPVALRGRAARPYPPAQVQVNGVYWPSQVLSSIALTWSHRNRVQQTGSVLLGFTDGGTSEPEAGTTYGVTVRDFQGLELTTASGMTGTSYIVPGTTMALMGGSGTIEVFSERDGLECFQRVIIPVLVADSGGADIELAMDEVQITPPDGGSLVIVMDEFL
ncbi:MAG: VWA domain-containing protein [Advenella sp.]